MIEKMKKYTFLIYHKEYDTFLEQLRSLGVVHIIEKQQGSLQEDSKLFQQIELEKRIKQAINLLSARLSDDVSLPASSFDSISLKDGIDCLNVIENLKHSIDRTTQMIQLVQKEMEKMAVWGDFDFSMIEKLKNSGHYLSFYSCAERYYKKEWESNYNAIIINKIGAQLYFVTLTPTPLSDEIAADKFKLSDRSYSELLQEKKIFEQQLQKAQAQLDSVAQNDLPLLQQSMIELQNEIELHKVKLNTESQAEEKVLLLEGWVPEVKEAPLVEMLKQQVCYYQSALPTAKDNVPVLLRNNRFSKLFEIIGELYSLPKYGSMDLTPFFAPFFVMFFGLCLGDAGYGLLMILVSLYMLKKGKKAMQPISRLVMWLGIGTLIFGTISGTFFGITLLEVDNPFIDKLKCIMLDSNQLFYFALVMGAIQISFGMILKGIGEILYKGFKYSLDTWGWLLCLWGNGITYALTTMNVLVSETAQLIYIGVNTVAFVCMLFFNDPDSNILVNFGGGLWSLYNKLTGILGDMLSYIRLFALGISGAVMGLVFNKLAVNLSGDIPVISQLVMAIILILGHSMNIFMSGLGAFVHPMRLTFVEFYNNAGFEGGGKKYNPFKKKEQTTEL